MISPRVFARLAWLMMFLLTPLTLAQSDDRNNGTEPVPVAEQEPLVVSYEDFNDPLEPLNRVIFRFNDYVYRYALIPAGKGYTKGLPAPVRQSIANAYNNIREPLNSINHLLQGKPAPAGKNLLRFLTNSTVGILGLFDPASSWLGLEAEPTRLGDTLGRYGLGYGFYLVLPFIGTTDARNGIGRIVESSVHPVRYLVDDTEATYILIFGNFQRFAPRADAYLELYGESEDPYLMFRNQYLQRVLRDDEFGNADSGADSE